MSIVGIWGEPYIDLAHLIETDTLQAVHEEVCLGLARLPSAYTGGSHRSMGIMPAVFAAEPYRDYGEVLAGLSEEDAARFLSLGDVRDGDVSDFGEEREHELTRAQMQYLKIRHGVYFPWQAFYEMIPNKYWDQKSDAAGKAFLREAKTFFPKTIAMVESLPFASIGRCNIMGLDPNHHGTVHRDGDPVPEREPDHFMSICPAGDKTLFLWDDEAQRKTLVKSRAYWFNDHDFHGVETEPYFRYSIRVDGVFEDSFITELRQQRG